MLDDGKGGGRSVVVRQDGIETFAVAFRNWDRLDPARPVRPWLYGIAANLMRHYWRKERSGGCGSSAARYLPAEEETYCATAWI